MTDLSRREFVRATTIAAAAVAGAVADPESADAQHANQPDSLLAGTTLPTFRFALEQSKGRNVDGSYGKEATVLQLPISKGIAGVSMRLEPGAIRELHWHSTAAEWAYVITGNCRTTVIDPDGRSETNDFEPGDIWYFPRGHGHTIQCLGKTACHFILIFDNGYFSEFGTFSVTDWIRLAPPSLVAKNLGVPPAALAKFPQEEVYFAKGSVPPATIQPEHRRTTLASPNTHKFRMLAEPPIAVYPGGREWRIGQERFPISTTMTGGIIELNGGGLRELHWHPNSDEWQYVLSGQVRVSMFGARGRYREETLSRGDVGYIPMGYGHSVENISVKEPARILVAFNTGHYQAIELSVWLASNPDYLLMANFDAPQSVIDALPRRRVFFVGREGPE